MAKKLKEVFEARYNGFEGGKDLSPRENLFRLIESELEVEFERFSNRARFKTNDLFKLYKEIKRLKGEQPEYAFNGRDLAPVENLTEAASSEEVSTSDLEKLFKIDIGGESG